LIEVGDCVDYVVEGRHCFAKIIIQDIKNQNYHLISDQHNLNIIILIKN